MSKWKPKFEPIRLKTGFCYVPLHYSDDPDKDQSWAVAESARYGGMNSPRWRREMELDFKSYIGERVWPMISREYHHSRKLMDKGWSLYRVLDHGVRHPTTCLWFGVNVNGDRHLYREYYMTDTPISVNCQNILKMTGDEPIVATYIDPSTTRRENYMSSSRGEGLSRMIDIYEDNGISCEKADNSSVGFDKVASALMATLARRAVYEGKFSFYLDEMKLLKDQLLSMSAKPALTIDTENCPRAYSEIENLRWQAVIGDATQRSSPERTVDVDDEAADCLRYAFTEGISYCQMAYRPATGSWQDRIQSRKIREIQSRYHSWKL
jgi:hypothetical protein